MPVNYVVLVLFIAAFIMSVVLHEIAHGWVARACGDPTAEAQGRLSLNPVKHIDPFMTILMPALLMYLSRGRMIFGGAKPVPVNPYMLRNPEKDDLKVSLAGVTVNLTLAAIFGFSVRLWPQDTVGFTLFTLICVANLALAFFNLIPIPPLDGSHVFRFFLARISPQAAAAYERIGMFGIVLVILLITALGRVYGFAIDYVWSNVFMLGDAPWWRVVDTFRDSF
ncbi:MAG: site-2 protease family protein [Planctomycetota bacterium]|jgi:Zn-dependent protease